MGTDAWRVEAAAQLQDVLTDALRVDGVRVVAVDRTDEGALATFLVEDDPRLLGRVVPWDVEDDEDDEQTPGDWASDQYTYLVPWATYGTRRVDRGAFIEVTDDDLPGDHRFWVRRIHEDEWSFEVCVDDRHALHGAGRVDLLGEAAGEAPVCRATFDVHPSAPATAVLDLAFTAATDAARTGHASIVTASELRVLDVLGFVDVPGSDVDRVLDLALLDVDVAAWRLAHDEALRSPLPAELTRDRARGASA